MATFYGKRTIDNKPVVGGENGGMEQTITPEELKASQTVLTDDDVARATEILSQYKSGKKNLEDRIIQDELWWELRHWEALGKKKRQEGDFSPVNNSAWLFNVILNKHADAMDNIPSPVVLPRERNDELSAKTLSDVIPVIMEYNKYEDVYSSNTWEKLKHGSAVYGITWNPEKENGLGDIEISQIDILNLFYEPGITDIQQSKNLFITRLIETKALQDMYPDKKDLIRGDAIKVEEYLHDDTIDNSDKTVVVDWYYKTQNTSGITVVQYAKFAGGALLYASENIPEYQDRGYYDHGKYPIVIDSLFPEKGTPIGFGYIAVSKDPQIYIDKLSSNIMQHSLMSTKKRYFISNSTAINEDEFLNWNKPLIHVEGELSESRLQEMHHDTLSPIYYNVLQGKIDEMKDTSANRDVNSGGSAGGVTAASAIAALQEAGNKVSRDMISQSYRAYQSIVEMVIELIRQFYDEKRSFRVSGAMPDEYQFVEVSNQMLMEQQLGFAMDGSPLYRKPIFDLKVKAQKRNPFSRMEENERAKELYAMGFFAPENAQAAMGALEMMDFEGIDKVKTYVSNGKTLLQVVQQLQMQLMQIQQAVGLIPPQGNAPAPAPEEEKQNRPQQKEPPKNGNSRTGEIMASRAPQSGYTQNLVKRSSMDMNNSSNRATPV